MISQLIVKSSMLSNLDETGTTVLEMAKCGENLVSDQKVDFSQNLGPEDGVASVLQHMCSSASSHWVGAEGYL